MLHSTQGDVHMPDYTALLAALAIVVAAGVYAAFKLRQIYNAARRREKLTSRK